MIFHPLLGTPILGNPYMTFMNLIQISAVFCCFGCLFYMGVLATVLKPSATWNFVARQAKLWLHVWRFCASKTLWAASHFLWIIMGQIQEPIMGYCCGVNVSFCGVGQPILSFSRVCCIGWSAGAAGQAFLLSGMIIWGSCAEEIGCGKLGAAGVYSEWAFTGWWFGCHFF